MSNMKKRIVAVILVVALLASMIVINVSAAEYVPMPEDLDLPRTMSAVYDLYKEGTITGNELADYLKGMNVFKKEYNTVPSGFDFTRHLTVSTDAKTGDSNSTLSANAKPAITGASDKMHYKLALGSYNNGDIALTVTYPAASAAEARAIAKGGWFNDGIRLTNSAGKEYELTWLDTTGELSEEAADGANALLNYDEETGEATVTISFTEEADFADIWNLECSTACNLVMYGISRLADVERVEYTTNSDNSTMTVTCYGSKLNDLDELSISAIDQDDALYQLSSPESFTASEDGSRIEITFDVPEYLPTGDYQIQVVAKDNESNVNDIEEASNRWNYVNPKQPVAPTINRAGLGGDYTIDVAVTANGSIAYDGYITTIEQYDEETPDLGGH